MCRRLRSFERWFREGEGWGFLNQNVDRPCLTRGLPFLLSFSDDGDVVRGQNETLVGLAARRKKNPIGSRSLRAHRCDGSDRYCQ